MKGIGMGRIGKALAVSLAIGLGMTACSRDYTLGYLYVTASRTALVNAYAIDYQSGSITQLADSPIPASPTTNANPVALVAAPNGENIYVINHDVSQVVQFAVGTDGKLYGQATTNVVQTTGGIGSLPTAAAIDQLGKFLFVTFTYQNGFTAANPGPGGVAVFPISSTGALGTATMYPAGFSPSGIYAAVGSTGAGFVYVVDQDHTASGVQQGVVLVYSVNAAGALTLVPGTVPNGPAPTSPTVLGYSAGTVPSAVVADSTRGYIYITDQATNQLYAYNTAAAGTLTPLSSSPYTTGQFPLGITIDPRGEYLYVANFGSNTVSAFVRNITDGSLSGGGGVGVRAGPTCVTVDPALGVYLFTSNNRDNSVSALTLNPHNGALGQVQGTPFDSAALPTCAVTIANGAHPTQIEN